MDGSLLCKAEDDADFAAHQADAKKTFQETVKPFVQNYCSGCHGLKRQKSGINFEPALKNPGESASMKQWKQARANVKAHDMPPESADKQPTDAEQQKFMDWIGEMKFLSAKDPGPFVIRRLTKTEYGNTLHDLFGEGFLNTLSPLQSEQYLGIANRAVPQTSVHDGRP